MQVAQGAQHSLPLWKNLGESQVPTYLYFKYDVPQINLRNLRWPEKVLKMLSHSGQLKDISSVQFCCIAHGYNNKGKNILIKYINKLYRIGTIHL